MFANEWSAWAIDQLVERLSRNQNSKEEIDDIYRQFVEMMGNEMSEKLTFTDNLI